MSLRSMAVPALVACVVVFLAVTTLPLRPLDPFARSRVVPADGGGVEVPGQSLIVSAPGPGPLDAAAYRERRFAIEIVFRSDAERQGATARIVAHSRNPDVVNWLVAQGGAALRVRHGGQRAQFDGAIRAGALQHAVLAFDQGGVTLYERGAAPRRKELRGPRGEWDDRARLTLANEVTGDRPWRGAIRALRLYEGPVGPDEASALLGSAASGPPAPAWRLDVEGDRALALVSADGARIGLEVVPWPWELKVERMLSPYGARRGSLRDVIQNVLLGAPLGFLLGVRLRDRTAFRSALVVLPAQAGLSLVVETVQFFSVYRTADWVDVLANTAGALAGLLLARRITRPAG